MKIIFISDTHLRVNSNYEIPDGDVLVHCGDATMMGRSDELRLFNDWMKMLPHRHKIFVAGNHDLMLATDPVLGKSYLTNMTYLWNESILIEGIKFYGSPYTPQFGDWGFMRPRGYQIAKQWAKIPDDVDVLITHGPPYGILDETGYIIDSSFGDPDRHVGCEELRKVIDRINPRIHAFGHIHEGYGKVMINDTVFINASTCNGQYRPVNAPHIVYV